MTEAKNPVICVFCGSSPGKSEAHVAAARELAHAFHKHGVSLVYGGGTAGVMGEVARTLVQLSGPQAVQGVIPRALLRYEAAPSSDPEKYKIDETIFGRTTVVPDMHTRKQTMTRLVQEGGPGSGFIALSGGYGTLEELMETVTWNQLGIHEKGLVVFNVEGYWDGLIKWVGDAVDAGFVGESNRNILVESKTAEQCVELLKQYKVSEGRFKLSWGQA